MYIIMQKHAILTHFYYWQQQLCSSKKYKEQKLGSLLLLNQRNPPLEETYLTHIFRMYIFKS